MTVIVSSKMVLNAAASRKETLDGRDYTVVPVVLIKDGVFTANAGALFYPPAVNSKKPDAWNQRPMVVYHPEVNGQLVSARSPGIIEKRGVGFVFNANYNAPNVGGEAWFDDVKADAVDDRILKVIKAGETLEVSTGFELDFKQESGEYNGEKYTGIVTNVEPDHLAILPDKVGACGVKKGCGCGVNVVNELKPLVVNEASFSRIERGIQSAMEKSTGDYTPIYDVYSDFFVYSKGYAENRKLYKKGYSVDKDGKVTVADGEPTEVKWVMEYRDTKGNFVGNSSREVVIPKEPNVADKNKDLITKILAYNVGWEEKELTAMDEPTLQQIDKTVAKVKASQVGNTKEEKVTETPKVTPDTPKVVTPREWLVANNAPPIMHQIFDRAEKMEQQEQARRATLVANILKIPTNRISEATLNKMGVEELTSLEETLTPQTQVVGNVVSTNWPNYAGQGVAVGNTGTTQKPLAPADLFAPAKK